MSTTMEAKVITRFAELKFIERFKYQIDALKSTLLTVRFGYLYPKERIRFVCAFTDGPYKFRTILL
jgi:hypothetical protein